MPILVNTVLNAPIFGADMTRYVRKVEFSESKGVVVVACSPSEYPLGGASDRCYLVDLHNGEVKEEIMTERQAFELVIETLTRTSQQFVNKDGMTGGRCVELAQETLDRLRSSGII